MNFLNTYTPKNNTMAQRGVNKVILIGNLGQDPQTAYMQNGEMAANLSLATSETWKDKQTGQPKEKTEWHRVVLYRRLAEIAGEYLRKGSKVYIEGRLQTREYTKDGVKHYVTEILADELQMLDGKPDTPQAAPSAAPPRQHPQQPAQPAQAPDYDDDIPF